MSGKRQPTEVVKANGRKHLTVAEEEARRDREIHVPPPDKVEPPDWFPKGKKLRAEYCEIAEILRAAGLFSELDRDVLAQYFVARERWVAADKQAAKAIKDKKDGAEKLAREWTNVQSAYFRQARQCAEVMGLSVSSRCRLQVPEAIRNAGKAAGVTVEGEDEFTQALTARQARAGAL